MSLLESYVVLLFPLFSAYTMCVSLWEISRRSGSFKLSLFCSFFFSIFSLCVCERIGQERNGRGLIRWQGGVKIDISLRLYGQRRTRMEIVTVISDAVSLKG